MGKYLHQRLTHNLEALSYFTDRKDGRGRLLRLDSVDLDIFAYIEDLDRAKSVKVEKARDAHGRPWVNLGALCANLSFLRLKPQATGDRIRKMATMYLLDYTAGEDDGEISNLRPALRTISRRCDALAGQARVLCRQAAAGSGRPSRARILTVSRYSWSDVPRYRPYPEYE